MKKPSARAQSSWIVWGLVLTGSTAIIAGLAMKLGADGGESGRDASRSQLESATDGEGDAENPAIASVPSESAATGASRSSGPIGSPPTESKESLDSASDPSKLRRIDPTELRAQLVRYTGLKRKVVLSDEDKAARRVLIENPDIIHGLGAFLSQPALGLEAEMAQAAAIDLAFEALRSGAKDAAVRTLVEAIKDPQIENAQLPADAKRNLAGVKAEILYTWSAENPSLLERAPAWLPGPASQRIWQNVLDAQSRNAAESAFELNR